MGHLRSPFNRSHDFLSAFHRKQLCNYLVLLQRYMATIWLKVAVFFDPAFIWPQWG